jgi:hypothetical protein
MASEFDSPDVPDVPGELCIRIMALLDIIREGDSSLKPLCRQIERYARDMAVHCRTECRQHEEQLKEMGEDVIQNAKNHLGRAESLIVKEQDEVDRYERLVQDIRDALSFYKGEEIDAKCSKRCTVFMWPRVAEWFENEKILALATHFFLHDAVAAKAAYKLAFEFPRAVPLLQDVSLEEFIAALKKFNIGEPYGLFNARYIRDLGHTRVLGDVVDLKKLYRESNKV